MQNAFVVIVIFTYIIFLCQNTIVVSEIKVCYANNS